MATKRLQQNVVKGPNGEYVKIAWMPGDRIRLDFTEIGPVTVKWLLHKGPCSHVELAYQKPTNKTTVIITKG